MPDGAHDVFSRDDKRMSTEGACKLVCRAWQDRGRARGQTVQPLLLQKQSVLVAISCCCCMQLRGADGVLCIYGLWIRLKHDSWNPLNTICSIHSSSAKVGRWLRERWRFGGERALMALEDQER